ncbi:hypothetical protein E3N88_11928 [Mikania micrantha]|uniref:Uncharacterized protein n=1 Tax=Mikania micrantha TaxID=192012 RepID=A0A5N6P466_9ASTR|nr:hypothetical protein E3N88_11928 [Mikania micrantha]
MNSFNHKPFIQDPWSTHTATIHGPANPNITNPPSRSGDGTDEVTFGHHDSVSQGESRLSFGLRFGCQPRLRFPDPLHILQTNTKEGRWYNPRLGNGTPTETPCVKTTDECFIIQPTFRSTPHGMDTYGHKEITRQKDRMVTHLRRHDSVRRAVQSFNT